MTGQDAANTAKAFGDALPLSGVVLTKTDGDARGGAALSVRQITGKPIKYIGSGEKTDALEAFHPDRMASRILGMGDILSLVEQAHEKVDHEKAEKLARKVKKGKGFDLEDLRDQFIQMDKMGGLGSLVDKLPGMGAGVSQAMQDPAQTRQMKRMVVYECCSEILQCMSIAYAIICGFVNRSLHDYLLNSHVCKYVNL